MPTELQAPPPADPVFTTEILDPNGQSISGTKGVIAWAGSIATQRVSHVVFWSSSRMLLHERVSDATIEVLDPVGASIVGTRGALGYRANPVAGFADRQFVIWTDTQVFKVVPTGPITASVTEIFLPDGSTSLAGVRGVAAYEELTGPWTGTTLVFWRETAGVFIHSVALVETFEVVDPLGAAIGNPQHVIPYQRTTQVGAFRTELYIKTPMDVLRRSPLAPPDIAPFPTVRFWLPDGLTRIANARGVVAFDRVLDPFTLPVTEVLIWTDSQVILWSESLLPGSMATLPLHAPGGTNDISDTQGAVVYLNTDSFLVWTEIALWTRDNVFLHVTPVNYPALDTLEVVAPSGSSLVGIRGVQGYPRIDPFFLGMELLLWGTDNVYLHERYTGFPAGSTQEVLTPAGSSISDTRGADSVTRQGVLIALPKTQVVIWREGNVYLADSPKPPAPANVFVTELLTPSTDIPPSVSIPNLWGSLFETTIYHPESNELWLWSPERVLLHRDGSLAAIDVLTPEGDFIGAPDPPGAASLAVNYLCVPPPQGGGGIGNNTTGGGDDPGSGFSGPPSFASVLRTVANGVVETGQVLGSDVHVPTGNLSQGSSVFYITQPEPQDPEGAAIVGPKPASSVVPQCGIVHLLRPSPPTADFLGVEGFLASTPEIMHIIPNLPEFNFTYDDRDGDSSSQHNFSVHDSLGTSLLWECNMTNVQPDGFNIMVTYNTAPCPTNGPLLVDGTSYILRVSVADSRGAWSAISEVDFHMNGIPAPTDPVTPLDGGVVSPGAGTTVSWTSGGPDPEGDAVTYNWQVSTDVAFGTISASGSTAGTTSNGFTTSPAMTYYWRADATDGYENSAYGNTPPGYWTFSTSGGVNDPPEAQDILVDSFAEGSVSIMHILNDYPSFAWTYFDPEAAAQTDYEIRVGTGPGLNDMWAPGPAGGPGTSEAYAGLPLVDGTDYYLAVRVRDDAQWSAWNETLFHTNGIPPAPTVPVIPADGDTVDAEAGSTVTWTSGGADPEGDTVTYDWEVATDISFSEIVGSGSTTGTTSDAFATDPATSYYWKVEAFDGYQRSGSSSTFKFTTTVTAGAISGMVVDDENDEPIPGAMVQLFDSNDDVVDTDTTNANGEFDFGEVDLGTYSVSVTKSGYEDYLWEVGISTSNPTQEATIRLTKVAAADGFPLWLVLLLIIIGVIIALALFFTMKRKKPAEETVTEVGVNHQPYSPGNPPEE
jgi:hypothetical protein